jgi:hypothetical protein
MLDAVTRCNYFSYMAAATYEDFRQELFDRHQDTITSLVSLSVTRCQQLARWSRSSSVTVVGLSAVCSQVWWLRQSRICSSRERCMRSTQRSCVIPSGRLAPSENASSPTELYRRLYRPATMVRTLPQRCGYRPSMMGGGG